MVRGAAPAVPVHGNARAGVFSAFISLTHMVASWGALSLYVDTINPLEIKVIHADSLI